MGRLSWTLVALWLLRLPAFGQHNPQTALHDALLLENGGSFEPAAKLAKAAIDSRQLNGDDLGRGYVILAVACQGAGDLAGAQIAYEHALKTLEHDREHSEDLASALENYALFYSDFGQLEVAARMWRKVFHLRQRLGDHTATALALTRLAELALVRNQVREAQKFWERASNEAKTPNDLTDDVKAFFLETEGWIAVAEHHAPAAIASYQQALELVERSRGGQHWLAGWEHLLLGKAYAESGDFRTALANMQTGITILDRALGQKNPKYFAAELAYSRVLDRFGSHVEAAQMRATAEKASRDYYGGRCAGCTISVAALR